MVTSSFALWREVVMDLLVVQAGRDLCSPLPTPKDVTPPPHTCCCPRRRRSNWTFVSKHLVYLVPTGLWGGGEGVGRVGRFWPDECFSSKNAATHVPSCVGHDNAPCSELARTTMCVLFLKQICKNGRLGCSKPSRFVR